jgi:hypothetical protein
MDECRVTEVNVAVDVLNRMLLLGRPPELCPHRLTQTGIGIVA